MFRVGGGGGALGMFRVGGGGGGAEGAGRGWALTFPGTFMGPVGGR
jgi:hypothetical protein